MVVISLGVCVFFFLRTLHTAFHNGYTSLYSCHPLTLAKVILPPSDPFSPSLSPLSCDYYLLIQTQGWTGTVLIP